MKNPKDSSAVRLDLVRSDQGIKSRRALAAALDYDDPSVVQKWADRDSIPKDGAKRISDKWGYSIEWLENGSGPKMKSGVDELSPVKRELKRIIDLMDDDRAEGLLSLLGKKSGE